MKYPFLFVMMLCFTSIVSAATFKDPKLYKEISKWKKFGQKFKLCRIGKNDEQNKVIKKLRIFFETGIHKVSSDQLRSIHTFMEENFKDGYMIELEGHSDILGNERYNKKLSNQRVVSVREIIMQTSNFTEGTKFKSIYNGESKSTVHDIVDRFVEIRIVKKKDLKQFNSVYLINAAETMKYGYSDSGLRYSEIRKFRFPIDSVAFVMRDSKTKCDGKNLDDYDPKGPARLKEAMGLIAENLNGQVKVFLYTDTKQRISSEHQTSLNSLVMKTIKQDGSIWYQF